jgi:hypothetical protein
MNVPAIHVEDKMKPGCVQGWHMELIRLGIETLLGAWII